MSRPARKRPRQDRRKPRSKPRLLQFERRKLAARRGALCASGASCASEALRRDRVMMIEAVFRAISQSGLVPSGAMRLEDSERDGELADIRTIVLAGMVGNEGWGAFAGSTEARDGAEHPLDRWSQRVIEAIARELGAKATVSFRRSAFLAVPAMGAARRARPSFSDRRPDPSPLRALAFLSWRAGFSRSARHPRTSGSPEPMRILRGALVPEDLSGRRVLRGRL